MDENTVITWSGHCRVLEPVSGKWTLVGGEQKEVEIQVVYHEQEQRWSLLTPVAPEGVLVNRQILK